MASVTDLFQAKELPPYVVFETRAFEDPVASREAGHYVAVDVDVALIVPRGSRDRVMKKVHEWLPQVEVQVSEGRIPPEWLNAYRNGYRAWKEGQEAPIDGTDIKNWPVIGPAQLKMLQEWHVRSVEELANANEELLRRVGMGARELQNKARAWLCSANDVGKVTEQLAQMQKELEILRERNITLETAIIDIRNAQASGQSAKVNKRL
jgi:hypothetical protein